MSPTSARLAVFVVAASFLLASCSTSPSAPPSETPGNPPSTGTPAEPQATPNPSPSPAVDPVDVPRQFDFEATTLDGEAFLGSSLFGTPTVLWFWAPWCPICRADAPAIADALDEMPEGVQLLGVPGRADEESMRAFVSEHGLEDMVQIVDPDGSVWSNFSVTYQPAVVLIEADGTIHLLPGSIGKDALLKEVRSIL